MAWSIDLSPEAYKNLKKLSNTDAKRILNFLHTRIRVMDNPRDVGKPLTGSTLSGLWRYRVGDYRILCRIEDAKICILVVAIGHRSHIYNT